MTNTTTALVGLLTACAPLLEWWLTRSRAQRGEASSDTATARLKSWTGDRPSSTLDGMETTTDLRWTLLATLARDAEECARSHVRAGMLQELVDQARVLQAEAVAEAIEAGCSWSDVGREVGVQKATAWARWSPRAKRA